MPSNSDGSLIFDTRIDTSGINDELKNLYKKLDDTAHEISKQSEEVKDLTKGYDELNDALREAQANENPNLIRAYNKALGEVGVELNAAKDKLASLKVVQSDLRTEIRTTSSEFAGQVEKMSSGISKLGKIFSRMLTRFLGMQLLYKGLTYLKDALIATMPEFQELKTSLKNLAVEFINVCAPLVRIFTPALQRLMAILSQVANTVYNVIAALVRIFGGDLPERIESIPENLKKTGKQAKKATKSFASFDTIMQIGQNAMVKEADSVTAAMTKADKAAKETKKTTESIKDKLLDFLKNLGTISLAGLVLPKTATFLGFLNGLGKSYKAYKDMYDNGITWSNLTDGLLAFAQTVAEAAGFLAAIGWFKSAKGYTVIAAVLIAEGMGMIYMAYKDMFKNGITWENLTLGLVGFALDVAAAAGLIAISKFVSKGSGLWSIIIGLAETASFLLIAAGMCGLYIAFRDAFKNGINWENLTLGLVSFGGAVAGVMFLRKILKLKKGGGTDKIGKAGEEAGSSQKPTSAWKILGAGLAIVAPFLLIAAGMCAIYYAFPNAFKNGINWNNICQGLAKFAGGVGVALALALAGTISAKKAGGSIWTLLAAGLGVAVPFLLIAAGMCAVYTAFPDAFEKGINWNNICQGLAKFAGAVGVAIAVGTVTKLTLGNKGLFAILEGGLAVAAPFLLIAAGMCFVWQEFQDAFEKGINWGNLIIGLKKFGTIVGTAITVGALVVGFTGGTGLFAILAGGLAAAAPFLLIAAGMCLLWEKFEDPFTKGVNWGNLTIGLKDFATDLKDALEIKSKAKLGTITGGLWNLLSGGVSKMAPFLLIAAAICKLYLAYEDVFKNGIKWDNLVSGLDDFCTKVKNAFENLDKNVTNWWKNSKIKNEVIDTITDFFKKNKSNFSALRTNTLQNGQTALLETAQSAPVTAFRYSDAVTGNFAGVSRAMPRNEKNTATVPDFNALVDAFSYALRSTGFGAVMQVDGTTFAKLVYKYNGSEMTRVGPSLIVRE